ncbi:MAG TPA: hypothetical protein VF262_08275 [Burkholderiales bacterium]
MSQPARDVDIIPLWPTWLGQLQLPDAEEPNRELAAVAGKSSGNLFGAEHRAGTWLRGWVNEAMSQWFEKMRVASAPAWRLSGRLEALGFGQYRELGNEPGAYLAGFYFVNAPAAAELDHLRSDCRPSHVSMLDPRVGFNALALEGDPNYEESRTFVPVPGLLMLWPGYVRHCSRVHLAREPWVRVALRIDLEAATGAAA